MEEQYCATAIAPQLPTCAPGSMGTILQAESESRKAFFRQPCARPVPASGVIAHRRCQE